MSDIDNDLGAVYTKCTITNSTLSVEGEGDYFERRRHDNYRL